MSLRPKDEATLAAAPKLLEFEQVAYTYPSGLQSSITSLSLRLPRGSRCGLIGENGCGKTTFFLLAHGLLRPQSRRILWHGKPFSYCREGLSNLRQRIGLVFQNPEHQLVATTVAEDLSYGLVNLGLTDDEIRSRIQTIAHSFDLGDLLDRQVHSLRWVPFTGQFRPLTSLTLDGKDRVRLHYRPHWEFCLPVSCAALHGSTSTGSGPG